MIRIKYFWPLLCCLLVAMVCYQGARIENQSDKINSLEFAIHLAKMEKASYDSVMADCESILKIPDNPPKVDECPVMGKNHQVVWGKCPNQP